MTTFIVYACPLGELAEQVERYFQLSQANCGPNAAHSYMPHCSLTGFFHDDLAAAPEYARMLDQLLRQRRPEQPTQVLTITEMVLREDFHGLLLEGVWLKALIADFASIATAPTRREAIRLKDWLHLSLAYAFPADKHMALAELARELVDTAAAVSWELRLYERRADSAWACHAGWPL
jgi:ubiquitin-associated SH3 domain-containing protein